MKGLFKSLVRVLHSTDESCQLFRRIYSPEKPHRLPTDRLGLELRPPSSPSVATEYPGPAVPVPQSRSGTPTCMVAEHGEHFPAGQGPTPHRSRANPQSDATMKPIGQDGMSQRTIPLAYHGRCCCHQLLPHSVKVAIEFDDSSLRVFPLCPLVCCRLFSGSNFQLHFPCNWRPHSYIHLPRGGWTLNWAEKAQRQAFGRHFARLTDLIALRRGQFEAAVVGRQSPLQDLGTLPSDTVPDSPRQPGLI
jgi:hypothetical protein